MVVRVSGKRMYMWRAVDREGEVLDVLVQKRRNKEAALKLLKKLLKNQGFVPEAIVTDGLRSYRAALRELGALAIHQPGRLRDNNRVEGSHLPVRRRERKMQLFKSQGQAQRFVSTHSAIYNNFNTERHLVSRKTMRKYRDRPSRSGQPLPLQMDELSGSRLTTSTIRCCQANDNFSPLARNALLNSGLCSPYRSSVIAFIPTLSATPCGCILGSR